jgi:hypothetical protein
MNKRGRTVAEQLYAKREEYKGLDMRNLVIRPGALEILSKPSRISGKLHPYDLVFKKER